MVILPGTYISRIQFKLPGKLRDRTLALRLVYFYTSQGDAELVRRTCQAPRISRDLYTSACR